MRNTNWLKEMSSAEFEERRKTCDTVIIPAGAIEVYGLHLPLGSDLIISTAICEMVAAKTNALIGPLVELGQSTSPNLFPGAIRARPETYTAIIQDILDSLIQWGCKNFIFINMHAGNVPLINQIAREYQRTHKVRCAQIDWWHFVPPNTSDICPQTSGFSHGPADECGTSVMLYLHPEYVDQSQLRLVDAQNTKMERFPDIVTYYEPSDESSDDAAKNIASASAEKGRAIVERCVERIVDFINVEFSCCGK